MIKVTMLKTAAGPNYVLQAGKTYKVPDDVGAELLAENKEDGKAAVKARADAVVTKLPATPDPGDTGDSEDVEEDDD